MLNKTAAFLLFLFFFSVSSSWATEQRREVLVKKELITTEKLLSGYYLLYNDQRKGYVTDVFDDNVQITHTQPSLQDPNMLQYVWEYKIVDEQKGEGKFINKKTNRALPKLTSYGLLTSVPESAGGVFRVSPRKDKGFYDIVDVNSKLYLNGNQNEVVPWNKNELNVYQLQKVTLENMVVHKVIYEYYQNKTNKKALSRDTIFVKKGETFTLKGRGVDYTKLSRVEYQNDEEGGTIFNEKVVKVNSDITLKQYYDYMLPFFISEETSPVWMALNCNGKSVYVKDDGSVALGELSDFIRIQDQSLWAFVGDPFNGFSLLNRKFPGAVARLFTKSQPLKMMNKNDAAYSLFKVRNVYNGGFVLYLPTSGNKSYLGDKNSKNELVVDSRTYAENQSFSKFTLTNLESLFQNAQSVLYSDIINLQKSKGTGYVASVSEKDFQEINNKFEKATKSLELNEVAKMISKARVPWNTGHYYRIVSAYENFKEKQGKLKALTILDGKLAWYDRDELAVDQLWYLGENKGFTLMSPNAQSYVGKKAGSLDKVEKGIKMSFSYGGQFLIDCEDGRLTALEAKEGDGTFGFVGAGNGLVGSTSAWYLEPVDDYVLKMDKYKYTTLYLPFEVNLPADIRAYTLGECKNDVVEIEQIYDVLPAGTPVIIEGAIARHKFAIKQNKVHLAPEHAYAKGVLSATFVTGGYIFDPSKLDMNFRKDSQRIYHSANKVYLSGTAGKKSVINVRIKGTTGVEDLNLGANQEVEEYYDLSGRRVERPVRGTYITRSGKKILF